jgi:hypothetical protein
LVGWQPRHLAQEERQQVIALSGFEHRVQSIDDVGRSLHEPHWRFV